MTLAGLGAFTLAACSVGNFDRRSFVPLAGHGDTSWFTEGLAQFTDIEIFGWLLYISHPLTLILLSFTLLVLLIGI